MRTVNWSEDQKAELRLFASDIYNSGVTNVSDFIEKVIGEANRMGVKDGLTLDERLTAEVEGPGSLGRVADAIIIGTLWSLGYKIIGATHEGTVIRLTPGETLPAPIDVLQLRWTSAEQVALKAVADVAFNKGIATLEEFYEIIKVTANALDADVDGANEYELLDEDEQRVALGGFISRTLAAVGYTIEGDNYRDGDSPVIVLENETVFSNN